MAFDRKVSLSVVPEQETAPDDALRQMLTTLVHDVIEREFTQFVGAAPYERSGGRRAWRNGYRERTWLTRVGRLALRIPRDRTGRFQPSLFARYERSEKALVLALAEMYVQGVSTRTVTHIVEQLCGVSISASEVSVLAKKFDTELAAWRSRRLDGTSYPVLVIDAHHEQVRRDGQVRSTAMLWAIGVSTEGYREHLGCWLGNSESVESWSAGLADLTQRGLTGVRYVVSDEHQGLVSALRRFLPDAVHQRCQVHYLRNALAKVSRGQRQQQLLLALRDIWAAPTRATAEQRLTTLANAVRKPLSALAEWLETTGQETLAVYVLPPGELRRRLRTTNSIEHEHGEMQRRTKVVRIFPNDASLLRLGTALAIERNDQWLERRYLKPEELALIPEPKARLTTTA
ncbi:MAG: IS256 family transposase [Gemmatimonadaceae bacterium]